MNNNSIKWPSRFDLFGVQVSATDYKQAEEVIIQAAKNGAAATVEHMPVHGLMTAVADENFRDAWHIGRLTIRSSDG